MRVPGENEGRAFAQAPAGPARAICCDVVDEGIQESKQWKNDDGTPKRAHKIRLVFQLEHLMDNGRRFAIHQWYTLSLNEKAALRKLLVSWGAVTPEQLENGIDDIESHLLGRPGLANVVHNGEYANIASIQPMHPAMPALEPDPAYIRVKDRDKSKLTASGTPADLTQFPEDDGYGYGYGDG